MVDYGQKKEYLQRVEHIDHYPDIAGVKISSLPMIFAVSLIPLWFDQLAWAVGMLVAAGSGSYLAARREDEGHPILLNAQLIQVKDKLPRAVQTLLLASIIAVRPYHARYRR